MNEFDPIPGLRVHPLATRTGVAEVDRALELVITGAVEGLAVLAVVAPQPCVRESGVFGVPCPDGADAATAVEVFAYGTCSGDFVYPEQLRTPFVRFLGLTTGNQTVALPLRIHSIEQIIPTPAIDEAAYVLHFAFADGSARHLPLRADGRIPTISLGCFDPDPIERHATTEHEWLLPPQT